MASNEIEQPRDVAGLADHLEARSRESSGQRLAQQDGVVGEDDPNGIGTDFAHDSGMAARTVVPRPCGLEIVNSPPTCRHAAPGPAVPEPFADPLLHAVVGDLDQEPPRRC